jgi:hypothetical protein
MAKPDFADVVFRSHAAGSIHAWVEGKFLGVVYTEGDGVFVRINERSLREAGRLLRSEDAVFDAGVQHAQSSVSGS